MAQNNTKNLNNLFQHDYVMVSESIVCFETSGHCCELGTGSPKVPFGTVNPLQKPRFLGESSGHWAQNPFQYQKTVDPILQTAIFGQDLNFPILTCQTTSQPINFKNAQHFPLLIIRANGMYPIPLGCRVYPIRQGLSFYAPQPRATPMMSPSWGQSLQFKVHALPDQNKTAKRRPNPKHDSTWISQ